MTTFDRIPVSSHFTCNGNLWIKKTTRTAALHDGRPGAGPRGATWCYFCKDDAVNHRLDRHLMPHNAAA